MMTMVDRTNLNDVMEFDHVIEVREDGVVVDRPDLYAPDLYNGELMSEGWTLLNGYSGQDRYPGPIMHNSEFIGGRMAEDILAEPGVYVALICYWDPEDPEDGDGEVESYVEGWAVARLCD